MVYPLIGCSKMGVDAISPIDCARPMRARAILVSFWAQREARRPAGVAPLREDGCMPKINAKKVTYVIAKAREGLEAAAADPAKDGADARAELAGFIKAMDEDERCELVALAWIGRGVFTREEWASALVEAHTHCRLPSAEYLLANPMLAPHLEHGLAEFVESGEGFERGRV